jgi:hypothetical protein
MSHAETIDAIIRVKLPCTLDLMVINGKYIWATWVLDPPKRDKVLDRVDINVRIAGTIRFSVEMLYGIETSRYDIVIARRVERLLWRLLAFDSIATFLQSLSRGAKASSQGQLRFNCNTRFPMISLRHGTLSRVSYETCLRKS